MPIKIIGMAINPVEVSSDNTCTTSQTSLNQYTTISPVVEIDLAPDKSIYNLTHKNQKQKKHLDYKSPYLRGNSVQLVSRVTEKRFIHKKNGYVSSFPLSSNIYKADSDGFKDIKNNGKKVLNSVLTLPNDSPPALQVCIGSDMNDSEDEKDYCRKIARKRNPPLHTQKCRPRVKGYDRNAQYCTDLDINFNSSDETMKNFGDGKRTHKSNIASKGNVKEKINPHEVWAVLRNMNRFQFRPSPQLSEDSFIVSNKNPKRGNNRKDLRVVETRRTEEFAYISSYKLDKSPCYSRCSSFDKVTVIDKKQDYKVSTETEDKMLKKKKSRKRGPRSVTKSLPKPKSPLPKQNNFNAVTFINQNKYETTDKISEDPLQLKSMVNNTTSVDLGYESKTTENDEDLIICDHDTQMSQYSVVYSDHSGSSKAAFLKQVPPQKAKNMSVMAQLDEPIKQMSGITKVTLSKAQNVDILHHMNKIETTKKTTRLTPDSRINTPKLTRTEINRQLNKYKFPITVLGKDQLRSSIHVINVEHPQFNGIEEQMWPFMQSWYGIERPPKPIKKQFNQLNKGASIDEVEKKEQWNSNASKQKWKDITPKIDKKRAASPLSKNVNLEIHDQAKSKPTRQFKDRMLKLLYKNSTLSVIDGSHSFGVEKKLKVTKKINASTDTEQYYNDYNSTSTNENFMTAVVDSKNSMTITKSSAGKRSWAKAKWASDFIENVIKKVKSGIYYNQDSKMFTQTYKIDLKEAGIQTVSDFTEDSTQSVLIPGFDNVLPEIEIKTMNMNEVSVKHCVTNIIVHFDVTVPTKPQVKVKNSTSLVPVNVTESLTKVFKCQTSILNAMLPAELCSIVPKILRSIMESGEQLAVFPAPVDQITCLSTITEVPTRCEFVNTNVISSILTSVNILPLIPVSQKLKTFLNGSYTIKKTNTSPKFHDLNKSLNLLKNDDRQLAEKLKPCLSRGHLFDYDSHPMVPLSMKCYSKISMLPIPTDTKMQHINTCTALQPYKRLNYGLTTARPINIMFGSMITHMSNVGLWISMFYNNMDIKMKIEKLQNIPDALTLRISNSSPVCLNRHSKCLISIKEASTLPNTAYTSLIVKPKYSENMQLPPPYDKRQLTDVKEPLHSYSPVNSNKTKRRSFVKLYRKCKSASSIYREKAIPLSRITNLDEFFQVLGSAKFLASVFEGQSGYKLLSLIKEMKNWTTDINSQQALLVLLLSNKKDTPNLVRYRPVLLQGIAVKRITKTHELDMEIEVIERENLEGTSHYEGISYLPASIENQDSLYEELCWIAKNAASDYQKPFNQNSERLLRSLLEKRKKLNPSYLRVMARYVGLGLLKSQGRKQTF